MNHIYKLIWNRARSCWQVVSELAKSAGRVKAVRRRPAGVRGAKRLALSAACALALTAMPVHTNVVSAAAPDYVVTSPTTTNNGDQVDANGNPWASGIINYKYGTVTVWSGGVWRPLDDPSSTSTASRKLFVDTLDLHSGSMADFAYSSTTNKNLAVTGTTISALGTLWSNNRGFRSYYITNANIDGGTFRINYGTTATASQDRIYITNLSGTNQPIYIQIAYSTSIAGNINAGTYSTGNAANKLAALLLIQHNTGSLTASDIIGQASIGDGVLTQYRITPTFRVDENAVVSSTAYDLVAYLMSLTWENLSGAHSTSAKMTGDAQLALRNMWRVDESNLFSRMNALRLANTRRPDGSAARGDANNLAGVLRTEDDEGVWANLYNGSLNNRSSYGRSFDQQYNGFQVGYDKLRAGDFYSGRLYTGLMLTKSTSNMSYLTGRGDLESSSIGAYGSWLGHKGHFLNLVVRSSHLKNRYGFFDSQRYNNADYDVWAYGVSAQYGYRKNLANGFFLEPQLGLSVGTIDGMGYQLDNGLQVQQGRIIQKLARAGLLAGKDFGSGSVYAKASVLHDFGNSGAIQASFNADSLPVQTAADRNTWYEFSLGAKRKLSPTGDLYLDLAKTTGGDVRTDWQVNGGLSWRWGGGVMPADARTSPPAPAVQTRQSGGTPAATTAAAGDGGSQNTASMAGDQAEAAIQQTTAGSAGGTAAQTSGLSGAEDAFHFEPVTVEAKRPAWEKELSPGTVSVVYPEQMKGEHKTLPDYLEQVPGVHVQRVNGVGQYTVARVRGSTGAQVGVYIDGVPMKLSSEAAVDLSSIPMENIAKIEVYRGYIPARFSGAPLGGVINVVTKKPAKTGVTVSQGLSSYGGQQSGLEVTTPLGSGSLLLGFNRDASDGNFKYLNQTAARWTGDPSLLSVPAYRERLNNNYEKTDMLAKWQDDNWQVKAAYKKDSRSYPNNVQYVSDDDPAWTKRNNLTVEQKTLLVGRRQTVGNLDWGWQVDYLEQQKINSNPDVPASYQNVPGSLWSKFDSKRLGFTLDTALKMGGSHLLEFHGDYSHENLDVDAYYNTPTTMRFLPHYDIDTYHLQLQDTITLNRAKNLWLTPVVRADQVKMTNNTTDQNSWQYSSGVALKKQLNANWTLRSSWGTYNRFPNFYEIYGDGVFLRPAPNTGSVRAIPPSWEHGSQWDMGATWQGRLLKAKSDITVTYFNRKISDLVELYKSPLIYYYAKAGDGVTHGVETEGNFHWDRWDLQLAATYTYTNLTKNYPNPTKINRPFNNIPEWEYNTRLTYRFPGDRLAVFAEYHYTDKLPINVTDTGTGTWQDELSTLDLGLKYNIRKDLKLITGVNDVFNKSPEVYMRSYSSDGSVSVPSNIWYPLQGRTYYVTLQYTL